MTVLTSREEAVSASVAARAAFCDAVGRSALSDGMKGLLLAPQTLAQWWPLSVEVQA